ncbi:PREDICTED: putative F-box protein At1g32420-like [Fragaria vesca subsp. vesca]
MEIDGRTTCFAGDVVVEILSRLPVKSLLQFLCVSKEWHGLIKSSYFTANHLQNSDPNLSLHFKRKTPDSEDSVSLFRNESIHLEYIVVWNPATKQFRFLPETDDHYLMGLEFFHDIRDYKVVNILPSGLHNTIRAKVFTRSNKIDVQTLQSSAYQLSIAATSACLRKFGVSFPGFDHSDETLKLSSLLGPFIEIKVEACSSLW